MPLHRRQQYFIASGLVLSLALWLRVTQLYNLPVFGDEADHLYWSQQFSIGGLDYPLLMDGKFLLGVLVAQFQPAGGPAPLWLGRIAVGLCALLSVAACICLGTQLGSPEAGLLAGLVYAALPQAIHHERQMLADPLMAAFGSVAIAFTWRLARKGEGRMALGLGAALAAAILAKLFGGLYLTYPPMAGLLLIRRGDWKRSAALQAGAILVSGAMAGLFLWALQPRLGSNNEALLTNRVGFVHCPPLLCQGDLARQLADAVHTLPYLRAALQDYFGWPIVVLALLAWPLALPRFRRRTAWLFLAAAVTFVALISASSEFPPRYIFFVNTPLVTLGSLAIVSAARRSRAAWGWAAGAGLAVLALWPMTNSAWLIWAPRQATLAPLDANNYYTGYFRSGFKEAAGYISAQDTAGLPPYVIVDKKYDRSQAAYLDRGRMTILRATALDLDEIGRQLLGGRTIYFVEVVDGGAAGPIWLPFDAVELGRYWHDERGEQVRLSRLVTADATERASIFRRYFTLPEELSSSYADLVAALPADQPLHLLVYPPNHAQVLGPLAASRASVVVIPIGDHWPLDPGALDAELGRAVAGGGEVRIAFEQETHGDPRRLIETWLNTHLFRLGETWFGPVRLAAYAGAAGTGQAIQVGARFGDGMQLDSIDVLDSTPAPGGVVRLRLTWKALAPMAQQYKIFTHIFAGDRILAQHDGQPVGELRPTTTWQVGETIVDQFAIRLPADAQPGDYKLRVGVYDLVTQARLPMTLPDGTNGEFFVGGVISLK